VFGRTYNGRKGKTKMKEKDCECKPFNTGIDYYSKLFEVFDEIASSRFKDAARCGEGENTIILKCKKCNSYYIWDNYSGVYLKGDKVGGVREFIPDIDDKGLVKILKNLKGTVMDGDIKLHSKALKILREAKPQMNDDISKN
jgi:hypothetical protein